MRKYLILILALIPVSLMAQLNIPQPSRYTEIKQEIGFTEIELHYSRPNLLGRALFGEMIPYGSVWRTGANANTKIFFSKTVFLEGNKVEKGKYGLYTIPGKKEWTLILNSDTTLWGHYGYNDSLDVLRFKVRPQTTKEPVETFHIAFEDLDDRGGIINLRWGDLSVPFRLDIDWESQDREIEAAIAKTLALPLDRDRPIMVAHDYLHAAMYYFENDKDLEQALAWINKGIEIELVSYFPLYKAEILAGLKRYDEAIEASKQGLEIFMVKGTNEEWIWRYEEQIDKWNALKNN